MSWKNILKWKKRLNQELFLEAIKKNTENKKEFSLTEIKNGVIEDYISLIIDKENLSYDTAKEHAEDRITIGEIGRKINNLNKYKKLWSARRKSYYYREIL